MSTLPLSTAADRGLAARFLLSVGVASASGLVPAGGVLAPLTVAEAARNAVSFAEAAKMRGTVTRQSFSDDGSAYGGAVSGKVLGKLGGAGDVQTIDRTSSGGEYFDGVSWQAWAACG